MKIHDWQHTQNKDYLVLAEERLKGPKLMWVQQFVEIINNEISSWRDQPLLSISVSDYGCNVGHFFRGVEDIKCKVRYLGFDISETYLSIARQSFGMNYFRWLDVASNDYKSFEDSDISVISATLEHLQNYTTALKNIFGHTSRLVVLRTFIGDESLTDICHTKGAEASYLVRQFLLDEIIEIPTDLGWNFRQEIDFATGGEKKMVCNFSSIPRAQSVLVFSKFNEAGAYAGFC